MKIEIKNRLDEALNSSESEQRLIDLVEQLKIEGLSQLEIYDVFESIRDLLDEEIAKRNPTLFLMF